VSDLPQPFDLVVDLRQLGVQPRRPSGRGLEFCEQISDLVKAESSLLSTATARS
jgi:hypothetical protein